jgi:prepilin-type N-terminal cleavage/methylation domain-containing protein
MGKRSVRGFTLVELLVVIAIIGVMVGLLLPAVQAAREASRRSSCTNSLKQLTLAMHNYESTHKVLPARMTGTGVAWTGADNANTNTQRASGWVMLLPFIEQQALSEQIQSPLVVGTITYPAGGPTPNSNTPAYPPWQVQLSSLICPSDPNSGNKAAADAGRSNYRFSSGDSVSRSWARDGNPRGLFAGFVPKGYSFAAITDGTSNTIALSERLVGQDVVMIKQGIARMFLDTATTAISPILCVTSVNPLNPREYATAGANWSGRRWANGLPVYNGFTTVYPPNSVSCTSGTSDDTSNIVLPPTSNHPGGAVASMADGSVSFISDSINSGDPSQPERAGVGGGGSPYGIWGALGSKSGGESVSLP